jgi:hypothetical protein
MLRKTAMNLKQQNVVLRVLLPALFVTAALGQNQPSGAGGIRGLVFTIESGQERSVIPGARIHIKCPATDAPAVELTTDGVGRFTATDVPPCQYRVTTEFTGMEAPALDIAVEADKVSQVEIEMKLAAVKEEVTVSAQADVVSTSETSSKGVLLESTLTHAPNATERVDNLLPLIPGVVRGPDGLINMKGARTSQSGMLLNSANITDPVTGTSGMNLPIDVVSTAEVVANPYDSEYGKTAGAVATVETKVSDFDKFHFKVQNFMPRMRRRDGSIMGVEASTPRLTITTPVVRGRVALTQSFEYRFVRTPVDTLPPLKRDTELESFDSFTQVDLNLSERQNASVTVAFYPQKLNYLGLNTFTPQEATPDLRQRGHFLAFSDKWVSPSGALFASQVSFKTLDSDVKPHSQDVYELQVETTTGGFFNRQDRDTNRFEWQEVITPRAVTRLGQHQFKAGWDFVRNSYDGQQTFSPVEVLRNSGMPAERITYAPGVITSVRQREYTGFVQDQWTISPKVMLDAGVRLDRDSLSDENHAAPRIGLAISPFANGRTVIRGGAGYFYDRINLNIPTFCVLPAQTVIRYDADGSVISLTSYPHRLAAALDNPRSTAWNVEVQEQLRPDLMLRAGYSQRNTVRDFFLQPEADGSDGALLLSNAGRNRYREFQINARYQIARHVVNASYVRSGAIGDLNDFNQYFGNAPNPIIRPNERGRLPFDAPNRFLFWGQFTAPWKITVAPVLDVHTGFPYSVFDEERDFVGARNKAGRFPRFASTDLQVTKEVRLPVRQGKYKAIVGVRVFNLLNHYNPRDIQANTSSERYGVLLNSVDRIVRGKLVLEF